MEDIRCLAVGCVVMRGDEVLLVRHTYGPANGKVLIPGGYLNEGEMPDAAAQREVLEETGVKANVVKLIGIRFKPNDWYAIFLLKHVSGEPHSDGDENSEAFYISLEKAVELPDITEFSCYIVQSVLDGTGEFMRQEFCPGRTTPDQYAVFGF